MSNKGLPLAKYKLKKINFGNVTLKSEKPNENYTETVQSLNYLEIGAKKGAFKLNDRINAE